MRLIRNLQNIHRHTVLDQVHSWLIARDGMAAIATHDKISMDLNIPAAIPGDNAGNAFPVFQQAGGLVFHEQLKGRKAFCVARKKVQKIPLRHKCDKLAGTGYVPKIGNIKECASDDDPECLDPLVRQFEKLVEQAQFLEHFERGGMNRVAAKIAEEVLMFFENGNPDTAARQKIAEHHAGGTTAHDATVCFESLRRHRRFAPSE